MLLLVSRVVVRDADVLYYGPVTAEARAEAEDLYALAQAIGEDALWDDARPADEVWTEALDWWEVAA